MIGYIIKKIKEFYTYRKIIELNKKIFKKTFVSNKEILLIEFNAFHNFHVAVSVFSNLFKKKKIVRFTHFLIIHYFLHH